MPDPLPPPHMDEAHRRSGEDLISGLPDEVLHAILVRLRSARAAARTGVLSRRWRHVWPHMPELILDRGTEAVSSASFLDAVDGALAGCLAPSLERHSISMLAVRDSPLPPGRAAPWLRFAAERVAGELRLSVLLRGGRIEEAVLEVPVCVRAKAITLHPQNEWRLRLQSAGLFAALTVLRIHCGCMEGNEITTLVSTRCPRLIDLRISVVLVAAADVSLRSDSLRLLRFRAIDTQRLEVVTPRLEDLTLYESIQAHVSAPNLAKLIWQGGIYNPGSHRFHDVGRRLLVLDIGINFAMSALLRRFDEVDVLKLGIFIRQGVEEYQSFLNETKMLPKCKALSISLYGNSHGVARAILHLLRSCNGIRKFSLTLEPFNDSSMHPCPSSCPCCLEDRIVDIDLSSLDEVEISSGKFRRVELEFLEMLSRCKGLKKLVINYKMSPTPETKEVSDKVRGMYGSNVEVEFYVFPDGPYGKRERFD